MLRNVTCRVRIVRPRGGGKYSRGCRWRGSSWYDYCYYASAGAVTSGGERGGALTGCLADRKRPPPPRGVLPQRTKELFIPFRFRTRESRPMRLPYVRSYPRRPRGRPRHHYFYFFFFLFHFFLRPYDFHQYFMRGLASHVPNTHTRRCIDIKSVTYLQSRVGGWANLAIPSKRYLLF